MSRILPIPALRYTVALILLLVTFKLNAQDKEYWFVAPDATNQHGPGCDRPTFLVITTGSEAAYVEVSMPANTGFTKQTSTIPANSYWKIDFTGSAVDLIENSVTTTPGQVTKKGLYIKSTTKVSAYYQVDGSCSKDIFTLKGAKALGTEFYTPFQYKYPRQPSYTDQRPQIQIVATEDGTTVEVTPKTSVLKSVGVVSPAGTKLTYSLNKGETVVVCQEKPNNTGGVTDCLNGSYVKSTKPIAITLADDALYGPNGAHDLTGDQIVPVTNIGASYVAIRGFTQWSASTANDYVYLLATEDNTKVYVNGSATPAATLNKGTSYQYEMVKTNLAAFLSADKPVYCYQQSGVNDEFGAALLPSMYSINANRIAFYKQNSTANYLFLTVRKGNEDGFRLNGSTIPAARFTTNFTAIPGLSDWMYARLNISTEAQGQCVVENTKGTFSIGYFLDGSSCALYGYLSGYGQLEFKDTTWKCMGSSVTLDAGYAKSYHWSTGATTPSITVSQPGSYSVTVDQDPFVVTATTVVFDDTFKVKHSIPDYLQVSTAYNFTSSVKRNVAKTYAWTFAGANTVSSNLQNPTGIQWSSTGAKTVTLKVTNTELGCDTTVTKTVNVFELKNDQATATSGVAKTIDVLANDVIPNCTPVVSIATAPTRGTATVSVDNKIIYTPSATLAGDDELEYNVSCGGNIIGKAKVNIGVAGPIIVEWRQDGNESGTPVGKFVFKFANNYVHPTKAVRITYQFENTGDRVAIEGTDFQTISPHTIDIPVNTNSKELIITPINNFIVDGNRQVKIKILGAIEI